MITKLLFLVSDKIRFSLYGGRGGDSSEWHPPPYRTLRCPQKIMLLIDAFPYLVYNEILIEILENQGRRYYCITYSNSGETISVHLAHHCLSCNLFHKTLPKSSWQMHCISVRFYEMDDTYLSVCDNNFPILQTSIQHYFMILYVQFCTDLCLQIRTLTLLSSASKKLKSDIFPNNLEFWYQMQV